MMFYSRFKKKLDALSPEATPLIQEAITVEKCRPKKPWIIGGVVSLASLLIVTLSITLSFPKDEAKPYRALNAVAHPHNALHHRPSESYLDSLRSFASSFGALSAKENENVVFSPVSIASSFSMAYEASSGESKKELGAMLGYDGSFVPKEQFEYVFRNSNFDYADAQGHVEKLSLADAFFLHEDFLDAVNPDFLQTLTENYYADAYQGKLESPEMHAFLASWINEKTDNLFGLTKDDFKDSEGMLWLVNAVYAKANWAKQPDSLKDVFHGHEGDGNAIFLNHEYRGAAYISDDYLLADVPLVGGLKYRVIIDNPDADGGMKTEKERFQALLSPETFIGEKKDYDLEVSFPKYTAEGNYDLVDMFRNAGILDKAVSPKEGDFSYAFPNLPFTAYISGALHQAKFDVDEKGIEAAAYTHVSVGPGATAPVERVKIKCDRPFRFALIDEFETPLFLGSVNRI